MSLRHQFQLGLRMNWLLTAAVLALITIGVMFIYSATFAREDGPSHSLYQRQIIWAMAGLTAYVGFAVTDYRRLRRLSWAGYALGLGLLVLVLVIGKEIYGAKRWLMIGSVGVQPSELAKVAVIFVLARCLSVPGENLGHMRPLFNALSIVAVPFLLIMKEPDLGSSLVLLPVTLAMLFVAGLPFRFVGALALSGLAMATLVLAILFLPQAIGMTEAHQQTIMRTVGLSAYHRDRLMVFVDADRDPLGAGWNKRQSEIAVGSGGLTGKGFLNGTQNMLGFLPRSVSSTDFIFSVVAEEKGFMGSATILGLFSVILMCGIRIALAAPDKFGRLLCTGIVTMLFVHVFINTAMTVGLVPITGIPLPLLSYGGSFMVIVMAALGIVQSVHIRSQRAGLSFEQGVLGYAV